MTVTLGDWGHNVRLLRFQNDFMAPESWVMLSSSCNFLSHSANLLPGYLIRHAQQLYKRDGHWSLVSFDILSGWALARTLCLIFFLVVGGSAHHTKRIISQSAQSSRTGQVPLTTDGRANFPSQSNLTFSTSTMKLKARGLLKPSVTLAFHHKTMCR